MTGLIDRATLDFLLFDLFDAPINAVSCSGRDVSTVAPWRSMPKPVGCVPSDGDEGHVRCS